MINDESSPPPQPPQPSDTSQCPLVITLDGDSKVIPTQSNADIKSTSARISTPVRTVTETNNTTRNLKRCFIRIDSLLPGSTSLIGEHNSIDFYRGQMEEARDFVKKLTTMVQREDLNDAQFHEINRCLVRLKDYIAVLDKIQVTKLLVDKKKCTSKESPSSANQKQIIPQMSNGTSALAPANIEFVRNNCIPKYNGIILHWPMFWATFQDFAAHTHNGRLSDRTKFRVLYHNVDNSIKTLLSDVDPLMPNMKQVFQNVNSHFSDEETIRYGIEKALADIPLLKDGNNNDLWHSLANTAKLAKVLITGKLSESWDKYFANFFVCKLSPKHYHRFLDKLSKDNKSDGTLTDFSDFCLWSVRMNQRMSNINSGDSVGQSTRKLVSDDLCLLCQQDYHYPQDCDIYYSLDDRKKIIRDRRLCRRCLVAEYYRGHDCGQRCNQCNRIDHHVALCAPITQNSSNSYPS